MQQTFYTFKTVQLKLGVIVKVGISSISHDYAVEHCSDLLIAFNWSESVEALNTEIYGRGGGAELWSTSEIPKFLNFPSNQSKL